MTRDFNNQRREDPEADSRGSSSRRPEEERPSRPARPRLNRDMVDRAWENGARQNHADYRTRSDSNMQSSHGNRRPDQRTNRYSAQNSSNGRKPYGNRRENYPPGGRSSYSDTGTRSRTYDSSKRSFEDRSNNQYERRSYPKQSYRVDHRQGDTQYPRHPHPRSQYQERDQYRGPKQREFDRETPSPRNYDRTQRQAHGYEHNTRKQRSQERDIRPSRNGSGPYAHNPRWQNRPERRENNYPNRSREYAQYETEQQLFEGDYEHFDRSNPVQSQNPQTHPGKHPTGERNVTRLPDGRVLKGSSGEQQRGAEFWTEIVRESDDLVKQTETSHSQETAAKHTANPQPASATSRKSKPRTGKTSEPTRGKKPTKVKAKQRSPKPRATGPKPSQRGFKWPTPEE
jgi:hypothetical protein